MPAKPYKFLDHFTEADRAIFFGREREIRTLISDIVVNRLVVLFARTGTGKTSLIKAGVIPRLANRGYATLYVRVRKDPVASLKVALQTDLGVSTLRGKTLSAQLENLVTHRLNEKLLVIFFDQFEEFFVYTKAGTKRGQEFISDIARIYENRGVGLHVVFSMREEFFVEMDSFRDRIPTIFHNESNLRLQWFNKEQALEAIAKPAFVVAKVKLASPLLKKLIEDLSVEGKIEPTQLQVVCDTLWRQKKGKRLTLDDYKALGQGGLHGNIAQQILKQRLAEKLLGIRNEEQLELLERLLPELRTERNTKFVRSTDELVERLNVDKDSLDNVLALLVNAGFISKSLRGDAEVVELTHDYLVEHLTDLEESVRSIWPKQILGEALKEYSVSGASLTPADLKRLIPGSALEKLAEKEKFLILSREESELLFFAALANESHDTIELWFNVALQNEVPVWKIMGAMVNEESIAAARFVMTSLVNLLSAISPVRRSLRPAAKYDLRPRDLSEALSLLNRALVRSDLSSEAQSGLVSLARSRDRTVALAASDLLFRFLRDEANIDKVALPSVIALGWIQTQSSIDVLESLLRQDKFADTAHIALSQLAVSPQLEVADRALAVLSKFNADVKTTGAEIEPQDGADPARLSIPASQPQSSGLDRLSEPQSIFQPVEESPELRHFSRGKSDTDSAEDVARYLAEKIRSGECILFLGAGIHVPSPQNSRELYTKEDSPPFASEISRFLAQKAGYLEMRGRHEASASDLQRVAQYFELQTGRMKLVQEVKQAVSQGKRPSPMLHAIARLDFKYIVTTNFDTLLEHALREAGKSPFITVASLSRSETTPDHSNPSSSQPVVLKLQGDIGIPESLVLTEDDHLQFILRMFDRAPFNPVPDSFRYHMAKWPSLFLGYNFNDYVVRLIFKILRWKLDGAQIPPTYVVDADPDQILLELWDNQRRYLKFIIDDLWSFVPRLYTTVTGDERTFPSTRDTATVTAGEEIRKTAGLPAKDPYREVAAFIPLPTLPYRGLEPYDFADQRIFFARESDTQGIVQSLATGRCLLLHGDAGVGMTSLLNAGVITSLIDEGYAPEKVRLQPRLEGELMLDRIPVTGSPEAPYLPTRFFVDIDNAPRMMVSATEFRRLLSVPSTRNPVLIFDQFEEIITLFDETADAPSEANQARMQILNLMVELIRDRSEPLKILLVIRENFLGKVIKLLESFSLYEAHDFALFGIQPPPLSALTTIIRGPFEAFPKHFDREISPAVAGALLDEFSNRPLNLAEVQVACLRLWESNDPLALLRQFGLAGVFETYLSDVLSTLPVKLRDVAIALMSRMVTSSGLRMLVSEDSLVALVSQEENVSERQVLAALNALNESKLVRCEVRRHEYFYELISEFLSRWLVEENIKRTNRPKRRL